MSALNSFDQGSSVSLNKFYDSITTDQWLSLECITTIHAWINEVPRMLENEETTTSNAKGGGWAPRRNGVLGRIITEALTKNTSKDSLWRGIYIKTKNIKPVIILGLIHVHFTKAKYNLIPEEVAEWPTAIKDLLGTLLIGIKLPSKIANGVEWIGNKWMSTMHKRKNGENNMDHEPRPSKQPRIESSEHLRAGEDNEDYEPRPSEQSGQDNPQPYPQPQSQQQPYWKSGETVTVTAEELNRALLKYIGDKECYVEKLGPSPESAVRVDPIGRKTGFFSIFLGQTGKSLATSFDKSAKDHGFCLQLEQLSNYVLRLVESGDKFDMVYSQGIAIVCLPPDYFLVLMGETFTNIRDDIQKARKRELC